MQTITSNKSANWKVRELEFDWKEFVLTEEDWSRQSPAQLRSMLEQLYLIHAFENKLLELKNENMIHGPVHTSIGQEAVAVGVMAGLLPSDGISGTHRAHHQYLAKAYTYHISKEHDPLRDRISNALQQSINTLMAEIMGLSAGCCGGRGGSMHLCDPKIGVLGTNAIVGGGIPLATGSAFAEKYNNTGNIVASFFSDGAVNQGAFHEALNLAGLWKLPILYVLENNLYAVATHVRESSPVDEISIRAAAYGMPARIVDGNHPLALMMAVQESAAAIRSTNQPMFLEARTYRKYHHAGDLPGSAFGYRSKDEEADWKARDPLAGFAEELKTRSLLNDEQDETIRHNVDEMIKKACEYCLTTDDKGKHVIRPSLIPTDDTIANGVRSDGREWADIRFVEPAELDGNRSMKYVEAIAAVTGRWLEKDPSVFVLGEEVGHMKGGPYLATQGLAKRFPGRVLDTPISEAGFTGLAGGAAMHGLKPVVEIMFPDFALVAADQIFNQIGKLRHMYGGKNVEMPLVMRTRIAVGCGYGGQHSMDPTALFALFSGWRIIAPATPADYVGLFNTAMQSKDPVLIVEHHELYNTQGPVPDSLDFFIEFGKARKISEGNDVTVLTHSWSTTLVKQAAEELADEGINVDAIDLRTLSMPDIDYDMIGESFRKTMNMVIVEQSPASNSIGARIGYECQRRFFDFLDSPIITVTAADIPSPVSRWAEAAAMPTVENIKSHLRKSVKRRW